MNIDLLFTINFSGVLMGASIVTYIFLWPHLQKLPKNRQLAIALSPQMFRLMALGLLHPALSPGLSMEFAVPTAAVDVLVSVSAMIAVILLHKNHSTAHLMTFVTVILGLLHMLISGYYAAEYNFSAHLEAQWLIPVMLGPLMVISLALTTVIYFKNE